MKFGGKKQVKGRIDASNLAASHVADGFSSHDRLNLILTDSHSHHKLVNLSTLLALFIRPSLHSRIENMSRVSPPPPSSQGSLSATKGEGRVWGAFDQAPSMSHFFCITASLFRRLDKVGTPLFSLSGRLTNSMLKPSLLFRSKKGRWKKAIPTDFEATITKFMSFRFYFSLQARSGTSQRCEILICLCPNIQQSKVAWKKNWLYPPRHHSWRAKKSRPLSDKSQWLMKLVFFLPLFAFPSPWERERDFWFAILIYTTFFVPINFPPFVLVRF